MHTPPRRRVAGLTLVETALLLSLAGVVLAVAVPTLTRAIETSKVSEASEQLSGIYVRVAAYYAEPRSTPTTRVHCVPDAAGPTPANPSPLPVKVDFGTDPTWVAIAFAPDQALRYRYTYFPSAAPCGADAKLPSITLRAEGDLDDDGVFSLFERTAKGAPQGHLVPDGILRIRDRVE